ncbi:hypothetical protein PFFCH_02827 [Plasmodium falciparum FCH/4]|uniref:Rhoptry neck protein 3 n=1 Tax=Plasmodium falciparum FCH/4 TaxID=1036724 RepID=A0A024VMQ8_PLAFA|nr:hypothetical protein PFFCH_02827 [Plasmodium falciparum FCH/4]
MRDNVYFHKNVAMYESFSRTNFFFYLTILNKKNVKKIVKIISKAERSSTDSYWSVMDALKKDGLLLARTFLSVSFVQSLRGIIGLINHKLIDLCFTNAYVFNHVASFDKLIMNNIFGVIMSYVFKSLLLFFYPLIIPFRGAFAFAISAFCITQLGKIVFAIYKNLRQLYRISYRKIYSIVLKVKLRNEPELKKYAMKLLYGDALIMITKIWKLSYVNVSEHLNGKNVYPILNNLFEKNLGTGFFDFSNSLFKYVMNYLEEINLLNAKSVDVEKELILNRHNFKLLLKILKITKKSLLYEESYMKISVANLLTKFYTLILVNIEHISKLNPKEHFYNDLDNEFKHIYQDQMFELFIQKISSDIVRKPFIKRNIGRIDKGSIELTLALIKVKLLHYKPTLNNPYSSLYFDENLKKQLNYAFKLIIIGSTSIIASLANYGERYGVLKQCPLDIVKNLNQQCEYVSFEIKKLIFPINIFVNLLIPLFLPYDDVLVDKNIIDEVKKFFNVIIDTDDSYLQKYMKTTINTIRKSKDLDINNVNYEEEMEKIVVQEAHKVIEEINKERRASFKFQDFVVKEDSVVLYNKSGIQYSFKFDHLNRKEDFMRIIGSYQFKNPISYQTSQLVFEPQNNHIGSLMVGSNKNTFDGKLSVCHMCYKEDDDSLVVDAIFSILWSSGIDRFSAFIFASFIGAVKQTYHQGTSWKRALSNMAPTEFYEMHKIFMDKSVYGKEKSQNYFLKNIRKYRFQFSRGSFSRMFRTFLENSLNKINFFNSEEAIIILVMSTLYALYKNIEKFDIPLKETYKLYQQKLIESYYHVDKYSHHYETYTLNIRRKKYNALVKSEHEKAQEASQGEGKDEAENAELKKRVEKRIKFNDIQLTMEDEVVRNTKYLQLELQAKPQEREKIIQYLTYKYKEIPNHEMFPHLPHQCYFLLYYNYEPFLEKNLHGLEGVVSKITRKSVLSRYLKNINLIQPEKTRFASINLKDLINILCGTHMFLKKEHITFDEIYKYENSNDALKHLLIIVALLRIEKRTNRYSWTTYLTLQKQLDERKRYYDTPFKYLFLKISKVRRFYGSAKKKMLLGFGKKFKGVRFLNILRYTRFFEIMEYAESINEFYPYCYIKFEDVLTFSNVFYKFKYSLLRYTTSKQSVRNVVNNFNLSPQTTGNNENLLLRIYRFIELIIKKKYNVDIQHVRKDDKDFNRHAYNKNEYILNDIKFNPNIEQYLRQLTGFIKLLTDMKFTNFLFLRNLYYFVKFYAVTGDLTYSINNSSIYLCSRNYLEFILNSIIEFENFKKFMVKIKEKFDIEKYPIDPYNFQTECYSIDSVKTYRFFLSDLDKLKSYQDIENLQNVSSFYKDYLYMGLFYENLDVRNLNVYYNFNKKKNEDHKAHGSNVFLDGGLSLSKNMSFSDINDLSESIQNYLYLEKFLADSNIPSIPYQGFSVRRVNDGMHVTYNNRSTTPPLYKDNVLDQFELVGKSLISEYFQKVKCSFIQYPFNLYYWLVLNPGKPNISLSSKTGLIKEDDLIPKTVEEKLKEEEEHDIKIVENILSEDIFDFKDKSDDDQSTTADVLSTDTDDSETDAEKTSNNSNTLHKKETPAMKYNMNIAQDEINRQNDVSKNTTYAENNEYTSENITKPSDQNTENYGTKMPSPSFIQIDKVNQQDQQNDAHIESSKNTQENLNYDDNTNMYEENKNDKKNKKLNNNTKEISFLERRETNPIPFSSNMIKEKNKEAHKEHYGNFNRPYNIYVPKKDIFRNFHLVVKVVHALISLNKFSMVSPDTILKKGIESMKKKHSLKMIKNINPFIHKMILDMNETIQKLKSDSEKAYGGPKADIISLYKIVEFQLFNQYIIYPPLKRLTKKELKYILDVVNQGYYFYLKNVITKLKRENLQKSKVVKIFNNFQEFSNLLDDDGVDKLYNIFTETFKCKNIKCFDLLFQGFLTEQYNNIVYRYTHDHDAMNSYNDNIFNNKELLNKIFRRAYDNYFITPVKNNQPKKLISLEKPSLEQPVLTLEEFAYGFHEFGNKIEKWRSMLTLFNIRHIYINICHMLLSVKHSIQRSHRVFMHKFGFFGIFRRKREIYIP